MKRLIDVIVLGIVIAVVLSFAFVTISKARREAILQGDGDQMLHVHSGLLASANGTSGDYLSPSQLVSGPGFYDRRNCDFTVNSSANFYAALIGQNLVDLEQLVSPSEPNDVIEEMDVYNFDAVQPELNQYWDNQFVADLETGSNVSYAHMPLIGRRFVKHWRDTQDAHNVVLGNRGVVDGNDYDLDVYADSNTLQIHGPDDQWEGWFVTADHHVQYVQTFTPKGFDARAG